jgi:iron complex transport system permease protein
VSSAFAGVLRGQAVYLREAATQESRTALNQAVSDSRVAIGASVGGFSPATVTTIAMALLAAAFAIASFFIGPSHLGARELLVGLWNGQGSAGVIAREIRLPRSLFALLTGGALGASGAALQGLLRNPLADAGVTGVTSSAGLGAVLALYFGWSAISPAFLPGFAILGALVAAAVLYLMSRSGAGITALVLSGVAVSSLATSLMALALSFAPNPYAMSEIVQWTLGALRDLTLGDLAYAAPLVLVGVALLMLTGRGLDALTLGDEAAASLGIDVAGLRGRIVIGVALAVGAASATAGNVSFVGLVVPHLLRRFYAFEPSRLILPSALGGGALVAAADIAVRLLSPSGQLPLGVLTALLGAPFFIWLIIRIRTEAR